jgi:hypothetical protein
MRLEYGAMRAWPRSFVSSSATRGARLEAIVGDPNRLLKHVQRARIVLLCAERLPVLQVAVRAGVSRPAV